MLVLTRQADAGDKSIIQIIDPRLRVPDLDDDAEDTPESSDGIFRDSVIEIEVVSIRAGRVRLRIKAPRGVPVHRREIYDEIAVVNAATTATARLLGAFDAPGGVDELLRSLEE